jgi:SAM-dependent methyltransferase
MDIHPGPNVDVVGDAHRLSEAFPASSFDAIVSVAVFEHLFFPWKVAIEMNKVLKPGGSVFVATHPAWPAHELPWDFLRFQENGMHALFNKATGFKVSAVKEGLPARLLPLVLDRAYAQVGLFNVNMAIAVEAVKIGEVDARLRWDVPVNEITDTMYPLPTR